jgi:hypothetical protein
MPVCVCARAFACVRVCVRAHGYIRMLGNKKKSKLVCVCAHVCACVSVCMYVYNSRPKAIQSNIHVYVYKNPPTYTSCAESQLKAATKGSKKIDFRTQCVCVCVCVCVCDGERRANTNTNIHTYTPRAESQLGAAA